MSKITDAEVCNLSARTNKRPKFETVARVSHHPSPSELQSFAGKKARIYETVREGQLASS
jgi:hypothetical protein